MHYLVYHHALSTRFIISEGRINVCAMKDEGYNTGEILQKNPIFSPLSETESDTKDIIITSIIASGPHLLMLHSWDGYA